MLHIPDVELDPLLPRDPGAAVNLRPAGDTRPEVEAPALARRVELDLGRQGRARPDDPHLSPQDVEQVRQLIEGEAAQEPADARDPWVCGRHSGADADGVGTLAHRPQLEELEDHSVPADAALAVEDRSPRLQADRDRRDQT